MRFPDLLVEVKRTQDRVSALSVDLGYCIAELQALRNALVEALPEAAVFLRFDLPVSRETVRGVDDKDGPSTLF